MTKKKLCLLSALLLLGLMVGCGGTPRTGPSAEEIRRQREEAGMMRDAQESVRRMRRQEQAPSSESAE